MQHHRDLHPLSDKSCYLLSLNVCMFVLAHISGSLLSCLCLLSFQSLRPQERGPSNVSSATSPPPRSPTYHGTNVFTPGRNRTAAPGATTGTASLTSARLVALMAATVALMIRGLIGGDRMGMWGGGFVRVWCVCWWDSRWHCGVVWWVGGEGGVLMLAALSVCVYICVRVAGGWETLRADRSNLHSTAPSHHSAIINRPSQISPTHTHSYSPSHTHTMSLSLAGPCH